MNAETTATIVIASHRPDYVTGLAYRLTEILSTDPYVSAIIVTDYDNRSHQKKFPKIVWVFSPKLSISEKRNIGISHAQGELIGFTDDDCVPEKNWVQRARYFFASHSNYAAVEGKTVVIQPAKSTRRYQQYKRLERPGFRTNNIFYKASTLARAGGFDARFAFQREDMDLAFTVLETGGVIGYDHTMLVSHAYRNNEPYDLLKNCWNRRYDPLLFKKHPYLYRQHIGSPLTGKIILTALGEVWVLIVLLAVKKKSVRKTALLSPLVWQKRRLVKKLFKRRLRARIISYCLAPLVITAALVWGSIKHKKLLFL